ncbi:MAG: hypothetical protein AAGF88_01285 [Pseudomonadota bacterium]
MKVYTLLVHVGRKAGDGLPDGCIGAALLCYSSGRDEAEAVRETVAVLKKADLAPLEVEGHGASNDAADIPAEERKLMDRALAENAVILAQMTPLFEED